MQKTINSAHMVWMIHTSGRVPRTKKEMGVYKGRQMLLYNGLWVAMSLHTVLVR